MPWNEQKQLGRYEVQFKDRVLHDATEARAQRLGVSVSEYLQLLARAVMLMERGDPILSSLLGGVAAPQTAGPAGPAAPPAPDTDVAAPGANDPALLDSALDQLGL